MNIYELTYRSLRKLKLLKRLSDESFIKLTYHYRVGKKINLKNPKTFNEKLQWLKLYDRKPVYTTMVDKYEAKKYVAERIGEEYIIPNLGVWEHFDEIDFDALPEQFVLKCTHDSGGLVICKDKSKFDKEKAKSAIERSLSNNYYFASREWPYKNVKPRIIAERYMTDSGLGEFDSEKNGKSPNEWLKIPKTGGVTSSLDQSVTSELPDVNIEPQNTGLTDYKFFCFGGKPEFLYVSRGLEDHSTASISFVTMDYEFAPFRRKDFKPFAELPKKPENFEKMKELSALLSKDCDFLRVDFYEIGGKIYFSELTFYPCSGFVPFEPKEYNEKLGELLRITVKK